MPTPSNTHLVTTNKNKIPNFIYGTAWKEERTEELTFSALEAGFRAIDTANQRRHYFEEGVGQAIKRFLAMGGIKRQDLFLQTKYTYPRGQDHRKPYTDSAPYREQVKQSFASSLQHLGTDYVDSYVLHGPFLGDGVADEDFEVWEAMEELYDKGQVKRLGISNFQFNQLKLFQKKVRIKPSFLQNRCFAVLGWDKHIREFCRQENITYQGFSLLTANRNELANGFMQSLAEKYGKTIPQIVFRYSLEVSMIPLTGTTSITHMREDLNVFDFQLTPEEIKSIECISI